MRSPCSSMLSTTMRTSSLIFLSASSSVSPQVDAPCRSREGQWACHPEGCPSKSSSGSATILKLYVIAITQVWLRFCPRILFRQIRAWPDRARNEPASAPSYPGRRPPQAARCGVTAEHAVQQRDILARPDAARTVTDMDMPGFRLHPLKGELKVFGL